MQAGQQINKILAIILFINIILATILCKQVNRSVKYW